MFVHPEEHRRRDTCPHIHKLTHSHHIILLYPASRISALCCLNTFISQVDDELTLLSHHLLSLSFHYALNSLLHPLLLPFLSCSLPKLTPCASITCMMDSWERTSIDLSSEEADAERKHREKLQEALQTLWQQSHIHMVPHICTTKHTYTPLYTCTSRLDAVALHRTKLLTSVFHTRFQHLRRKSRAFSMNSVHEIISFPQPITGSDSIQTHTQYPNRSIVTSVTLF